ncbi:hypothetical protein ACFVH7_39450 [Kitasatospora indigofera]
MPSCTMTPVVFALNRYWNSCTAAFVLGPQTPSSAIAGYRPTA